MGEQNLARLHTRNQTPLEKSITSLQNESQGGQAGGHHIAYAYDHAGGHEFQVSVLVHGPINRFANLYGQIGQGSIVAKFLERIAGKVNESFAKCCLERQSQMKI